MWSSYNLRSKEEIPLQHTSTFVNLLIETRLDLKSATISLALSIPNEGFPPRGTQASSFGAGLTICKTQGTPVGCIK